MMRPIVTKKALSEEGFFADDDLVRAVNLAWHLEMPLLLTGEPGCGKTFFAEAVAGAVGQELKACYVRSDSTARDLLYKQDAVRRFADAQGLQQDRASEPRFYIDLQPLGEALRAPQKCVVLIDEIDKAPRDLPNDLLRELDHRKGTFAIPEITEAPQEKHKEKLGSRATLGPEVGRGAQPLVIITSNVERQLPDPFLRRCLFHHIAFPEDLLVQIVERHARPSAEDPPPDRELATQAVQALIDLRADLGTRGKRPATAELIQWVKALDLWVRHNPEPSNPNDLLLATLASPTRDRRRNWAKLPALECLIKLVSDRHALGIRA